MKYKQLVGIAIAGVILAGIFVPFQKANAFTVDVSLPNANPNSVPTSAVGSQFKVDVKVSPGEFISVSQIELIIDNNSPDVKRVIFDATGHRVSGNTTLTRGNLDVTIPSTSSAYGYGYGYVSTGTTFSPPNSFTNTTEQTFISGNTVGPNNGVSNANVVVGVAGPNTITIEGKLNTAQLSPGTHTLEVFIHTGSGGNGKDQLTSSLTFTTVGNSSIKHESVTTTGNVTVESNLGSNGKVNIHFNNVTQGGTINIEPLTPDTAKLLIQGLFTGNNERIGKLNSNNGAAFTSGTIYEIDISSLTLGTNSTIDVTIPYDPDLLPKGFKESNLKVFHWTGTGWEDVTVSVDTAHNTVTARLSSLSPVVTGYYESAATTTTTTTTSIGGGGGGGGSVILNPSFPADYFNTNPLAKLQIQDSSFKNLDGSTAFGAHVGQQVSINASFKNYQQTPQDYAMIIQVVDQNGFTTDIGWVTGTVDAGKTADNARSWTADATGNYTIKIFVWDNVSTNPVPLSEITTKDFTVSE